MLTPGRGTVGSSSYLSLSSVRPELTKVPMLTPGRDGAVLGAGMASARGTPGGSASSSQSAPRGTPGMGAALSAKKMSGFSTPSSRRSNP